MSGTLYGIGVGPGDPELITLKAARLLARITVVAYPAPETGGSMARAIASAHISPSATEIPLRLPFDAARAGDTALAYDAGAEVISDHLAQGHDVACLCEGDPLFYGSFVALMARLGERFAVEVVPGVSSLNACSAVLGHALALRDDALVVIPATRPEAEIEDLLRTADAAAVIKLGRHLPKVTRVLERLGLAEHARYVERAGLADQRIRTLAEMNGGDAPYFAMLLVHRRGAAWRP